MTSTSASGPLHVVSTQPAGAPSGPPVVLLHSFPSNAAADWQGWPEALAAAGRASHLIDLPGHGENPTPASAKDVTTGRIVADLLATIEGVGADEIDLVGYSLGARLAWELPGAGSVRVRRLVLGAIGPMDPFGAVNIPQMEAFAADGTAPTDPMTAQFAQMLSAPGINRASIATTVAGLATEPFTPSEQNAPTVPTLFVIGAEDMMMAHGLDDLIALVPDASKRTVPGDHRGALLSDEFRAVTLEFLTS